MVYLLAHLWHNRSPFSETCYSYRMSVVYSSVAPGMYVHKSDRHLKTKRKRRERPEWICRAFSRIVFDCMQTHEPERRKSLNRSTYEKFDNNGDHFKWFTFQFLLSCFVRLLRSIFDTCRSTPFPKPFLRCVSVFRLFYTVFPVHFLRRLRVREE